MAPTEADLRKKASLATNQEGPLPSPPLPSPFPSPPFLSSSLPSLSLPPPPLRSRPLFAARGSGGALKLPQRVRAEPGRQTHFELKIKASGGNNFTDFLRTN